MAKLFWMAMVALLLGACDELAGGEPPDAASGKGYRDGYAVGYNDKCAPRVTLIHGDFDNRHYADAYHDGYADGARDCTEERRE